MSTEHNRESGRREDDAPPSEPGIYRPLYTPEDDTTCWVCGGPVVKRHCKIICQVCGFTRDCSDP